MECRIWTVSTSIVTCWSDKGEKLVNLTPAEEKELDIWLMSHQVEFFLDTWDFNIGLSDNVVNLQFFYLPDDDIMEIMEIIRGKIEYIIAKRKKVK